MGIIKWYFESIHNKFDINLGGSNMPPINICNNLNHNLNYGLDKGNNKLRQSIKNIYTVKKNIIITHGAQEALFLFFLTNLGKRDHVISFKPGWDSIWKGPKKLGIKVTLLKLDPFTSLNLNELKNTINNNTKAIIINNPHNPTGYIMTKKENKELIKIAKKFNLILVYDDEYSTDMDKSIIHSYNKSISISGLSKIYGAPGLRIGWAIGNKKIIQKMLKGKRLTTISNSIVTESIACNILKNRNLYLDTYSKSVLRGQNIVRKWAKNNELIILGPLKGTPFVWIKLKNKISSLSLHKYLLEKKRILIAPSEVFYSKGAIRISLVSSIEELKIGLLAINDYLKKDLK